MLDISTFPWAECAISENRQLYISDSLSLKRSKRNTGAMRYEIELVTIDMPMNQGRGIKAKLSAAVDETLMFIHPRLSYSQGTVPLSGIETSGTNNAGSKSVNMTSTELWQLLGGDYIQFANDSKVYEVAEDTALQIGEQSVKLTSHLRNPITTTTNVIAKNVTWYLESNGVIETSMEASENQEIEITLVAVEKL